MVTDVSVSGYITFDTARAPLKVAKLTVISVTFSTPISMYIARAMPETEK